MRTGLCVVLLIGSGCAGIPPPINNLTETSCQDPCPSRLHQPQRDGIPGRSCRAQPVRWNDVGDALSGAATAVRLPRP